MLAAAAIIGTQGQFSFFPVWCFVVICVLAQHMVTLVICAIVQHMVTLLKRRYKFRRLVRSYRSDLRNADDEDASAVSKWFMKQACVYERNVKCIFRAKYSSTEARI